MSLILDALNKADHERRQEDDEMPGLDSHHDSLFLEPDDDNNSKRLLFIGAGAVVAVALAAGAYFWMDKNQPSPAPAPVVAQRSEQPQPRPTPKTAPKVAAQKPNPVTQPARPAQQQMAGQPPAATTNNRQARPQPQPAVNREKNPEVSALYTANTREESHPSAQESQPQRIDPQVAEREKRAAPPVQPASPDQRPAFDREQSPFESTGQVEAEAKPATIAQRPVQQKEPQRAIRPPHPMLNDFTQIGTIRSLPWTVQEKIPSLTYSEHNYKPNENGEVTLNGVTYRKGAQIAPNLKLESVVYDGILLRFGDDVFKLQALSSWVNM